MAPKIRRHAHLGHFHDLLIRACPPSTRTEEGPLVDDPNGFKSIAILAERLGLSDWGVRLWIHKGKIPPVRAQEIVDLNPTEVTVSDFSPYVYR